MNFKQTMNWILGRPEPAQPSEKPCQNEERRISPRLSYSEGVVEILGTGEFPLVDLAQGGLSINKKDHPTLANLQPGDLLQSRIRLGSIFFETDLNVCSLRQDEIGCAFGAMPAGHSRVLNDFLKPRILGASLREIRATEGNLRWFQGDLQTQVLFWPKVGGGFEKADFYFMDYVISFEGKDNSLRTGFVKTPFLGGDSHGLPGQDGAIVYHETPSFRALKLAHLVFDSANLPEDIYLCLGSIMFREEKCSFSRVMLGEKDRNITFEYSDNAGPVIMHVASLCATAISAMLPDGPIKRKIPAGTLLDGILRLPERSVPATFKVVFQHDFLLGGGLKLQQSSDSEYFASFLTPRLLGKSLELVPPPAEAKPHAPSGSRPSLHVGIHNTHLLSLITYPNSLLYGRLVFSDRIILWEKNTLSAFTCPQGLVFPSDWTIVTNDREKISHDDPLLISTVREILLNSSISQEVLQAWDAILPPDAKA